MVIDRRLAVLFVLLLLLLLLALAGSAMLPGIAGGAPATEGASGTLPMDSSSTAAPAGTTSAPSAETMPSSIAEEISSYAGRILINELLASNQAALKDEDGDSPDWIELYNASTETINLSGCSLLSNPANPVTWNIPERTLPAGGYLLVYASGKNRTGTALHTNFTLGRSQAALELIDQDGRMIDHVSVSQNLSDVSYGRPSGETSGWAYYPDPTPGGANDTTHYTCLTLPEGASGLLITEIMNWNVSTLGDQYGDYPAWLEISNPGDLPVNIAGFRLADKADPVDAWHLPDVTIQAGEHLVVFASGKNQRDLAAGALHTDFSISRAGETIYLYDYFGQLIDQGSIGRLEEGVSYGRSPDGSRWLWYAEPSPGSENTADGFLGYTATPQFSLASGFYQGSQTLVLSSVPTGTSIRFTLDGNEPNAHSPLYGGPITLSRTTVVRAATFRDGYRPGPAATATYFIDTHHSLSVVSLVMNPKDFDDPTYGIYSKGPNASSAFPYFGANFHQDIEVPCSFQLFSPDGLPAFQMDVGIQIFGGWTRAYDQKSFALFARTRYESDLMTYPFLVNKSVTQFKQLVLRTAGQDVYRSKIRDILATRLMAETNLDFQGYRFVTLYINGRYWGVYSIREKVNRYFIHYNHGIDDFESIDILSGNGSVLDGESVHYKALMAYIQQHDLADPEHYEYVKSCMDVDNYMDYMIMMMYSANIDSGNIRFWRERTEDGRWRWFVYDMDLGFGSGATVTHDTFAFLTDPSGTGAGGSFSTRLITSLLRNREFRSAFIERFAYHLKNTFATDRVIAIIDELAGEIEPEMDLNVQRWDRPASVAEWRSSVEALRIFARRRPEIIWQYVRQNLNLSAEESALYS